MTTRTYLLPLNHFKDQQRSTLKKAIQRENLPAGMIVHSDRGGQYTDSEFRKLLAENGFEQSMSRAGETYDNAYAESLFSRYKAEYSRAAPLPMPSRREWRPSAISKVITTGCAGTRPWAIRV